MARPLALAPLAVYLLAAVLLISSVSAQDFVLLNGTEGAFPIAARFPAGSRQYTPSFNQDWTTVEQSHDGATPSTVPLYFGNSFKVYNVRPQNDTASSTKRINPSYHFAMENQTIAMEGQEYLIRPRAYVDLGGFFSKRAPLPDQAPWDATHPISSPFTINPQWASFRLANTSDSTGNTVAFFDNETIQAAGATFEFWASNPSAFEWTEPGSFLWNTTDASTWGTFAPGGVVTIEWLVACRWIANGTDCAPSRDNSPCELVELGLCWARTTSPPVYNLEFNQQFSDVDTAPIRTGSWNMYVTPRPLFLSLRDDTAAHVIGSLFCHRAVLVVENPPNQPTRQLVVELPTGQFGASPFVEWWKQMLPGKDNTGGELTITVRSVIAHMTNGSGAAVQYVTMDPPVLTISGDAPSAAFRLFGATLLQNIDYYSVFFLVQETSPSTAAQLNSTNATLGSINVWPSGAYLMTELQVYPRPYEISIENWPASADEGNIQYPIYSENLIDCEHPGPAYIARISHSPAHMGLDYVRVPFNVTPGDGIQLWTCPTGSSKRSIAPVLIDPLTGLEFRGNNTAFVFYMTTQAFPHNSVSLQYFTPVLSNALLDPVADFVFPQNGTYTFDIIRNTVEVTLVHDSSGYADGPYTNEPFWFHLVWTPPLASGLLVSVTGLYSTYEGAESVTQNGTLAMYRVNPGATGAMIGPIHVNRVPDSPASDENFNVVYILGLLPGSNNSLDHWAYELPGYAQVVVILTHRFQVVNQFPLTFPDRNLQLSSLGYPSPPICIGPVIKDVITANTSVWLSLVTSLGGAIAEPVVPSANVLPPNAIELTAASPVACMTIRWDINMQTSNFPYPEFGPFSAALVVAGPGGTQFIDYLPLPFGIMVFRAFLSATVTPSRFNGNDNYLSGEEILMVVNVPEEITHGLRYNVTHPAGTVTPIDAGAGLFVPGGPRQHLWGVVPFVTPVSEVYHQQCCDNLGSDIFTSVVFIEPSGPDALYVGGTTVSITVVRRIVELFTSIAEDTVVIGETTFCARFWLEHPVVNGLTISPRMRASGASAGHVSFTPTHFDFVPGGVSLVTFSITGELLSDEPIEWDWSVSGADESHFRFVDREDTDTRQRVRVTLRSAPEMQNLAEELIEDVTFGPQVLTLAHPAAADEDVTMVIEHDPELVFSQESFDAHVPVHYFSVTYVPLTVPETAQRYAWFRVRMTGADAWKYDPTVPVVNISCSVHPFELHLAETTHVLGVRYTGNIFFLGLPRRESLVVTLAATTENVQFFMPHQATGGASILPLSFAPTDSIHYFEYIVTSQISSQRNDDEPAPTEPVTILIAAANSRGGSVTAFAAVAPRSFALHYDRTPLVRESGDGDMLLCMLNHPSQLFTVVLTSPPENAVTLSLRNPNLRFNGNQPVAMRFSAGQLTSSFTFTPISFPNALSNRLTDWNVVVTGADAALYDYSDLVEKLQQIEVVPEFGFSPIPPMFVDEAVSGLKVWMVEANFANGFPFDSFSNLRLAPILADFDDPERVVQITPQILEFTKESLQDNRLSQEYSITHLAPSKFGDTTKYTIQWRLFHPSQNEGFSITSFVPLDAQQVLLKRYQVVPGFPRKLNFHWQEASINLTRAPTSALVFSPNAVYHDGYSGNSGSHVPGGDIIFDPADIPFAAGQQVAYFRVKAVPGNDQQALYYRVDWRMIGLDDELYTYIDYVAPRSNVWTFSHFSTWHMASGLSLTSRFSLLTLLISLCAILLF